MKRTGTTDNEIIKALEYCNLTKASNCAECPLLNVECSRIDLYKFALDLINRQKVEIEALVAGQETLQKHITNLNAEIERLECIRDRQVQEFVERVIGTLFTSFIMDPEGNEQCIENLTDDMGIEEDEMWALFERLGYHKNNY